MSSKAEFFAELQDLRTSLAISSGHGVDRDRKRIAISVTEVFIRCDGDIHQAPYLEWQLYTALAGLGLSCNPIAEELRAEESPKAFRDWDTLKMHPRPAPQFLVPCALVKQIVAVLMEEHPNANRAAELERVYQRRSADQSSQRQPKRLTVLDRPGTAVHPRRPETLLSGGVGRVVARAAGKNQRRRQVSHEIAPNPTQASRSIARIGDSEQHKAEQVGT